MADSMFRVLHGVCNGTASSYSGIFIIIQRITSETNGLLRKTLNWQIVYREQSHSNPLIEQSRYKSRNPVISEMSSINLPPTKAVLKLLLIN